MTDPTNGCQHCGTLDTEHDEACPVSLVALIERYGRECAHAASLGGTRYAHHAGDAHRIASATLVEITERLGT